jgi:cytochrome c
VRSPDVNRNLGDANRNPRRFIWTADPDKIIAAVKRKERSAGFDPLAVAEQRGGSGVWCSMRPAALALPLALFVVPAAAQDEPGQILFNNACRTCHTVEPGDNRLGPTLHGVVGREAGSLSDYSFSPALKGSGIVWDETNLDRFIENPEGLIPGNNMKPYTGITSAEDRAAIIAYLAAQGGAAPK